MGEVTWFSCGLRLVVHIEGVGCDTFVLSISTFRAPDWEAAFRRALEIGREREDSYRNSDGALVQWRLVKVVTLDQLGDGDLDGREVYSEPQPVTDCGDECDITHLRPDRFRPTQSGV